jgi:hypothetical protein
MVWRGRRRYGTFGVVGGLVELGRPENLGRLLKQALTRAGICSSDPLCSEHKPADDRSLHAAACHACSFVSETSCGMGNRYIDRALLVPTLEIDADLQLNFHPATVRASAVDAPCGAV